MQKDLIQPKIYCASVVIGAEHRRIIGFVSGVAYIPFTSRSPHDRHIPKLAINQSMEPSSNLDGVCLSSALLPPEAVFDNMIIFAL